MRWLFAAAALLMSSGAAAPMEFRTRGEDGSRWIHATGDITRADGAALNGLLSRQPVPYRWIVFDSAGGSVLGSLDVGRVLRNRGMAVLVPPGGRCLSACFFAFIGGVHRQIADGGGLGVHQFYGADGSAEAVEAGAQVIVADLVAYVRQMGVAIEALEVALRTPSYSMHIFTRDELVRFGLHLDAPAPDSDCPFPADHVVADPMNLFPGCRNRR